MTSGSTPRATKIESTFRMTYSIHCVIHATPARVWALLTDADAFPTWNSTVTSIEGPIELGRKLALRVPLDAKRTFAPRVTRFEPNREMDWSDGTAPLFRGVRHFVLTTDRDELTNFKMTEVFTGIMMPLVKRSMPDFRVAFEVYAADLKRAAERA